MCHNIIINLFYFPFSFLLLPNIQIEINNHPTVTIFLCVQIQKLKWPNSILSTQKKEWNKIFLIPYFHDNSVSLSFSLYSGLIEEQIKTKG